MNLISKFVEKTTQRKNKLHYLNHKYVKTTIITGNVVVLGSGVDVAKLKK